MRLTWRHYAALAFVTFCLFLTGRMSLPPLDRDEPRYMEASAQMLESGDFIDVRFLDQPRYLQPAGIYWLEAGAEALFGGPRDRHTAWPYRIPSLIGVTLAVTLTAWIGASLFGGATGLLAGALLGVSTLMTAEGRMATIDTVLLLDILLVEAALLSAFQDRQSHRPTPVRTALLYWIALGCGLMLKGPVVLIPAFGTPLALLAVERQAGWWTRLRPAWGWLITVAIVLPWCVAIYVVSHGDFFHRAVGTNFLGKIGHGQQAHGMAPGYYLGVFILSFWPGALFTVLALPAIWLRRAEPGVRFLLCWIVPHWLVFEAIATKLPHYVLPTYPAIAILTAASLTRWTLLRPQAVWARALMAAYGVVWAALGLAFCLVGPALLWRFEHRLSPVAVIAAIGALPALLFSIRLLLRGERLHAALAAIAAAVMIHAGLFLGVIPDLTVIQLAPRAAALFDDYRPCEDSTLLSVSYSEPSLAFLAGSNTRFPTIPAAADLLRDHGNCTLVLVDRRDEPALGAALAARGRRLVEYGRVAGLNYSNGHMLNLGLFAAAKP
ncbi:ArnT family glycosyltransferase [Acidomonas methanolica]|uniref:ArnT family glycosyltransferase n=1 Tax=Acidomonas methanolica TaxID=437 RepID=UPI002119C483|nr:glycosyltransferase family 39 protein [Acidomonas methanolica]MCQ9155846.1 glycosyltransferase family 39 protein [Acidomonas methanolica]